MPDEPSKSTPTSPGSASTGPTSPEPASTEPTSPEPASSRNASAWERDVLERLALMSLTEQRRTRRWNLVFRFAWLAFAVSLAVFWIDPQWFEPESAGPHSALVDVRGLIADEGEVSADEVVAGLRAAFEDADTAGVILRINSPGGSPVQAGYISDEIVRLRGLHPDTPAVCGHHRHRRVGRLLRRRRRGRDLREQVERRGLDRGADERLRGSSRP